MAEYFEMKVDGLAQLERNLAEFGSERIVGRIIKTGLQAGARIVRPVGASNARALGLGARGIHDRPKPHGGTYKVYGRIPRALKVGKAYKPRGNPDLYRVNVVARSQRTRGIFPNKAPHAHLIEYGFTVRGGRRVAGRPYLGPAIDSTAERVLQTVAEKMNAQVEQLRMPT